MYSLIIFSFSVYWLYRGQRIYEVFGFWDKNCTRQVWSNIILQRFWNVTMTCAAFHVISSEFQFFFFFFFFNREAINRVCEAAGLKTAKKRKVPYILNCHYLCHRNIMEVHWIIKSIYSRPGWVLYFPPSKPLAFCCVYDKDFLLRFL